LLGNRRWTTDGGKKLSAAPFNGGYAHMFWCGQR
jgi:hypothetical protein